jgi:hypothetical protein
MWEGETRGNAHGASSGQAGGGHASLAVLAAHSLCCRQLPYVGGSQAAGTCGSSGLPCNNRQADDRDGQAVASSSSELECSHVMKPDCSMDSAENRTRSR